MFYQMHSRVGYSECDPGNHIKLSALMGRMQQASSEQLESMDLPVERLFRENMVFLLTKMCIKVHKMPLCAQPIVVGTAPVGIQGARFLREFTVESAAGERLVSALSLWILADPRTHKVLRPKSFPYELALAHSRVEGIVGDIAMPKLLGEGNPVRTDVNIRYSHLDINNHVNNSYYGDFVCDALPMDKLLAQGLETVMIHFQNEALCGETVEIATHTLGGGEYAVRGTHGGNACFDAFVRLKEQQSGPARNRH